MSQYSDKIVKWFNDMGIVKDDGNIIQSENDLIERLTFYERRNNIVKFRFREEDSLMIENNIDIGDPGDLVEVNLDTNDFIVDNPRLRREE